MSHDKFKKEFQKLNNQLTNALYSLPKNKIIQDDITTTKDNVINQNQNKANRTKLLKEIFKKCKDIIKKIYNAFMQNITIRNILSRICDLTFALVCLGSVIYCILMPYEKINYFYLMLLAIIAIISFLAEYRLKFKEVNICPKCLENDAIREKKINEELIDSYEYSDDEDIYEVNEYKCIYEQHCIYCDYTNNYTKKPKIKTHIGKTAFGKLREENMRHEKAMHETLKEVTDYRIKKEAEEWERRRRDY